MRVLNSYGYFRKVKTAGDGTRIRATAVNGCLLYTSDAADEEDSGELGGRSNIKKKKINGQREERIE